MNIDPSLQSATSIPQARHQFGVTELDRALGGGLKPGTLTVIAGGTGVGKTQLGLAWAKQGLEQEGAAGLICDLTSRGDSQNHEAYARDLMGWSLTALGRGLSLSQEQVWGEAWPDQLIYRPFADLGRAKSRADLDPDSWQSWRGDLAKTLREAVGVIYGRLIRGARRIVFDGIEPTARFAEAIDYQLFEYLYEKLIRRDCGQMAREWFREQFARHAEQVEQFRYPSDEVGCLYLYTTPETMLEALIRKPLDSGDVFAGANTIILMGRTREEGRVGRALYIAKHRGSRCDEAIQSYQLTDRGLEMT